MAPDMSFAILSHSLKTSPGDCPLHVKKRKHGTTLWSCYRYLMHSFNGMESLRVPKEPVLRLVKAGKKRGGGGAGAHTLD